jgi:hypothetical protein
MGTSGSEGGRQKPTGREAGRALSSDPTHPRTAPRRLFPQITRVLKINQLETITDYVIEAAASVLVIGN